MNENVKKVKLGNYISQIRGVSYKPTDLRSNLSKDSVILLRANNIKDGHINLDDVVYVDRAKVKQEQILRTGDILVCTSSGSKDLVGKAALVQETMDVTFGAFCKVIRSKTLYANFLGDYFQSEQYKSDISKVCLGININNLRGEHFDELLISAYDFIKQKEIAERLDKIDFLIDKRKQQLENLDKLIKSQFIEMFGDPASNPYGWEIVTIGDVVTEVRYGTSNPAVEGGQYPYLRMNNITCDGHLDLSNMKYIDISDDEIEKYIVRKGDILFNRTNSIELVGKTCLFDLDDPMVIAGYIIRIRLNNSLLPVVLSNYLNSNRIKDQLRSMAKGAVNQANINAKELQSIKVYLPPIDRQNKFSHFVEQTDKSKFTIKQSLEQLEILKKSLMQKYFG